MATRLVPPFVIRDGGRLTGFSIDLWKAIAQELRVDFTYEEANSIGDLLQAVGAGKTDLAIAAISITSQREVKYDFSQPICDGGLQIMVLPHKAGAASAAMSVVRDLFSWEVLKLAGLILLLILVPAHLLYLAERHSEGNGIVGTRRYVPGILKTSWWAAATLATQADEMPKSHFGRAIAIFWMFVSVVFVAYFTAQVTANLTVKTLQSAINGPSDLPGKRVATTAGSTAEAYLVGHGIKVVSAARIEDAYKKLESGDADAVVYDAPVLQYYAAHEGQGSTELVGASFKRESYGIVFPSNSPWRKPVNRALLELREDGTYDEIYNKWFGSPQSETH